MTLELRRFACELGRRDDETLHSPRKQATDHDRHCDVCDERQEREPDDLVSQHPIDDECNTRERRERDDVKSGIVRVEVGIARADKRSGRAIKKLGNPDDPDLHRREQQERNQKSGDVSVGRRLQANALRRERHAAAQHVQKERRDKRDDDESARHADHRRKRWKHEHIPANIPAEHGISDMKRRVVQKLEYLHPVTCRRQPEDQREDNPHRFDDSRQRMRDVYRRKLRTYTP